MKPPARNKKAPAVFKFDAAHVLDAGRVSKHRKKLEEREKKREARKGKESTPADTSSADIDAGTEASTKSPNETSKAGKKGSGVKHTKKND